MQSLGTQRPVLIDAVRSPFGKSGSLYLFTSADDIMAQVVRGLLQRNPVIQGGEIDEVAIAASSQIGDQGMNIGRRTALLAGLPDSVPGYAVDRWCAGALTSVTSLAGGIAAGAYDITIAGGVEHMGNHPLNSLMDETSRLLSESIVEFDALSMGVTAERLHDKFPHITKLRTDSYSINSQEKTAEAYEHGLIQRDLILIRLFGENTNGAVASVDEPPRSGTTIEKLSKLKTPFREGGKVTAGNSSGFNDGATAALLVSEGTAESLGIPVKAQMVSFAYAGVQPEIMGYGPIPSTEKALAIAGLSIRDIGLIEINEAFAIQVLTFLEHFGISDTDSRVNIFGGAIAVGHPLASSGIRLIGNLARAFEARPEVRYGITTMCIGLGMGGTVVWENPHCRS
jgi:acetyl-CoA acyltransferase